MKRFVIALIGLSTLFSSCKEKESAPNWEEVVMEVDREFSDYSLKHGMIKAFLKYASPDVVLIKPNMYPIVGHESLQEHYLNKSDTSFTLTWKPKYARVAKSGDLGYTFGLWELKSKDDSFEAKEGTYATIWQKQPNGEWKFCLDIGNEGLGK